MKQAHIVSAIASVLLLSGATFAFAETNSANITGTAAGTVAATTSVATPNLPGAVIGLTPEEKAKLDMLQHEQRVQEELRNQQAKSAGLTITPNTAPKPITGPTDGTTTPPKQVLTPGGLPLSKNMEALLHAQQELRQAQERANTPGIASTTKDYIIQRAQQALNRAQEKAIKEDQKQADDKAALACAGVAVDKRETSIQAAFSTFAASIQSALTTRQAGLKAAWAIESSTDRRSAIKDVWTVYTKVSKATHEALRIARNTAYSTFRADMKACKASSSNEEGGGFSSTVTAL